MKQDGFTLVEILVSMVIIVICGIIVTDLFIGQNRIYKVETAELSIGSDARSALDEIDNHVRQAYRTLASYSTYTASNQVLILQLRGLGSNGQILPGVFDIVVFYLDGRDLYREVIPDVTSSRAAITKKVASSINDLDITYNDADFTLVTEVTVDLTAQEDAGVQSRAITVSTVSTLRNYE
jgi:prepilin-type N-terminal cleavage/methylation domain-containing protein